ncbi:hypothetical protein [Peribacillus butanolivorans]|uniref:Uncharacterized protein n=1 Tax=Peribacillus butanolivorans TaxID=421767 RepID=A0ABM6XS33_9BACI|nr:hypothetical protein [Peribacillus butanolivorans]AXN41410.1 hypothetical protein DTO10_25585 [Peribacillus butanolivorans]QNU04750.1 hypothetical protein GM240_12900 [Peribacillus butanolivorans]
MTTGIRIGESLVIVLLAFCTVLVTVLSLTGERWVSYIIMRPISIMISEMKYIGNDGKKNKII